MNPIYKKKLIKYSIFLTFALALTRLAIDYHPGLSKEELLRKYQRSETKWININGLDVHYQDEGSDPVVVLVHGTSASLHTWDKWTEELKKNYRVIRMDIPGFGFTGPTKENNYKISFYTKWLEEFTRTLGVEKFFLAGNSLGGEITWRFALDYPQRLNGMILIDAAGFPKDSKRSMAYSLPHSALFRPLFLNFTPKYLVQRALGFVYSDPTKISSELVELYRNLFVRQGNREALLSRLSVIKPDHYKRISTIKAPTLIMWGEDDRLTPLAWAHRFNNEIPNSKLHIFKNAAHMPMEEIPERSVQVAKSFFQGQNPQASTDGL